MEHSRKTAISFSGSVAASSTLVLVSKRIDRPFRVLEFAASFPPGVNRTLQLTPYLSPDADTPTTGRPNGSNLLAGTGSVEYIVGDDERKVLSIGTDVINRGAYLKVYANNTDTFDHTVDAQIEIEIVDETANEKEA